jgi:type II secretory pathway pseudopilin PulG
MNRHKTNPKALDKKQDSGFNIIEVAFAMTIMGTCLAYAMPVILYAKINNSKSEARTAALIVSQQVFDDIRGRTFGNIPTADTTVTSNVTAVGRRYNVSVRYCRTVAAVVASGFAPAIPAVPNPCTSDYREFIITVRDPSGDQTNENSIIYETQAGFTSFSR